MRIKEAEDAIAAIHLAFFGCKPGAGLEVDPGWPEDHPAKILRKEIQGMRTAVLNNLRKASDHTGEDGYQTGEIDGVEFYSANFGVIPMFRAA